MMLIGMFDSPFVRRVAVSLKLLDLPFEHEDWSVGKDQKKIRQYSPLGRVPVLVLDDGEALIESAAILDYLDDRVGRTGALFPVTGPLRRRAMYMAALATGAAEKGLAQVYESVWRPAEKRHDTWVKRCNEQMHGALAQLEKIAAKAKPGNWLIDEGITQADVTVGCVFAFLDEAVGLDSKLYPALRKHSARCENMPAFKACKLPFAPPVA